MWRNLDRSQVLTLVDNRADQRKKSQKLLWSSAQANPPSHYCLLLSDTQTEEIDFGTVNNACYRQSNQSASAAPGGEDVYRVLQHISQRLAR